MPLYHCQRPQHGARAGAGDALPSAPVTSSPLLFAWRELRGCCGAARGARDREGAERLPGGAERGDHREPGDVFPAVVVAQLPGLPRPSAVVSVRCGSAAAGVLVCRCDACERSGAGRPDEGQAHPEVAQGTAEEGNDGAARKDDPSAHVVPSQGCAYCHPHLNGAAAARHFSMAAERVAAGGRHHGRAHPAARPRPGAHRGRRGRPTAALT
mmetsp:Transcript_15067/g.43218  ORF Transcript_15067/g.43218 Transcript_15067/m.43218 type:complete len:212 (-) Transcript_15067:737-1372(-)